MIQTKNRKHAYSLARDESVVDGCTLAQIHTDNIARPSRVLNERRSSADVGDFPRTLKKSSWEILPWRMTIGNT